MFLGFHSLRRGDLTQAERYLSEALGISEELQSGGFIAAEQRELGVTWLCQGRSQEALTALRRAAELGRELGFVRHLRGMCLSLGQAHLACQQRQEALPPLLEAAALQKADTHSFAAVLAGLEEAYESPEAFRGFCHRFREENPEVSNTPFTRWFLEPGEPGTFPRHAFHDEFDPALSPEWLWQDPLGDCAFIVHGGVEIRAANGRDLWQLNVSAPRLLRPVTGDLAAESRCSPASEEMPAIGGLLLWKDEQNYLRLDRGPRGPYEISFQGCIANKDTILGRGRLPSDRVFLRLEREGGRVRALCSADGRVWFTVGDIEFAAEDPVEVGLHGIGQIERLIYPSAYPDGTAIHFEVLRGVGEGLMGDA